MKRTLRRERVAPLIAALAVMSLVAAACGSDSDDAADTTAGGAPTTSGGPATTADNASTTAGDTTATTDSVATTAGDVDTTDATEPAVEGDGVTNDAIKIGGVTTLSSPSGFSTPGVETGFLARIERANRDGGIAGRMIDYVGTKDNELNPAQDAQVARELVQQDGVFLIAPYVSVVSTTGGAFLTEEKVPHLGWGITPAFCGNEYAFGYDGCLFVNPESPNPTYSTLQAGAIAEAAKQLGMDPAEMTVALQNEDNPAAKASQAGNITTFESVGFEVVSAETDVPTAGVTDWTPYVQRLMQENDGDGPDIVNLGMTGTNALGLAAALRAAGYEGILNAVTFYDTSVVTNPTANAAAQGGYTVTNYGPVEEANPATQMLAEDVAASAGEDTAIDYQVIVGYWIADMLVKMLEKTGRNLTRESFLAAANNMTVGEEGGYGPTAFPESHDTGGNCGSVVQLEGEEYKSIVPYACYPRV